MKKFFISTVAAFLLVASAHGFADQKLATKSEHQPTKGFLLGGIVNRFNSLALADLQTAEALAKGVGDTVADQCYSALITSIQNIQGAQKQASGASIISPITDFQKARMIVNALRVNGPIFTACATLKAQITQDAVNLPTTILAGLLP